MVGFQRKQRRRVKILNRNLPIFFIRIQQVGLLKSLFVTKTPTLNKKTFRWDDVVYMGELVSQVRCKPTTPIAVGAVNDT